MHEHEEDSSAGERGALPRALFCTYEIPQSINAGSMQLYRALQGYPMDRLMVLGPSPLPEATRLACRYERLSLLTYRLACTRFRAWTIGLNAWNRWIEPQLRRSLRLAREFRAELVVTVMDKLSYFKHAWALARRLRVPLLTITMDDPETFESPHPWLEGAHRSFLRRLYRDAAISAGVSVEMGDYLRETYGRPSETFCFGPVEGITPRAPPESERLKAGSRLTLGYAGSLSLGYREGLAALADTLAAAQARVHVYTRDQHALLDHPAVVNRGYLPPEQLWPVVQAECDALLLPYAAEGAILKVYRTHFPTKISEYCWTGLPLLLSGPDCATGIRWGMRNPQAALVATSPGEFRLRLDALRASGELRSSLAAASAEMARRDFCPEVIKAKFADLLRRAARSAAAPTRPPPLAVAGA